jgi:biopolymer transport protein ExbD|tara:strand:- start:331 stop:756 length:426 start_codon:yes stop_codon:yes gene_type:complete
MKFLRKTKRSAPSIIIVSLIDVLMVVLIFLVVSTTFKERLPAISLSLPAARNAGSTATPSIEPLIVSIRARAPHLRLNNKSITINELKNIFESRRTQKPSVSLIIRADKDAPFGKVVSVRDKARGAGITNIHAQVKIPTDS